MDESMHQRLLDELFQAWLQDQIRSASIPTPPTPPAPTTLTTLE
ncbi:hypothetical protein [Chamaesiphon sp. VAR_69_metabat_338]|nr:hypothetical protein [Chamaesiphon sp. VAR_69_metabat_338]